MASMNISIPDPMRDWVNEQVESGDYGNVSEYFRELVRRDQREKSQHRLEALLLEGLQSGEAVEMTKDDWADLRRRAIERAEARRRDKEAS